MNIGAIVNLLTVLALGVGGAITVEDRYAKSDDVIVLQIQASELCEAKLDKIKKEITRYEDKALLSDKEQAKLAELYDEKAYWKKVCGKAG